MARGKDRHNRPTQPFDAGRLAKLAEPPAEPANEATDDDPSTEWASLAAGTPERSTTPVVSRTTTHHDPLTTEVLAEVTRRKTEDFDDFEVTDEDTQPERPPRK